MTIMTKKEATEICCAVKDVYDNKISKKEAVDYILENTGQGKSSTDTFIYVFREMKSGRHYTREINLILTECFLDDIFENDLVAGLEMALQALWEHIQGREEDGRNKPGLRRIHAKFSAML